VPFVRDGQTRFVLDIDSDKLADFDDVDRRYLERIVAMIGQASVSGSSRLRSGS